MRNISLLLCGITLMGFASVVQADYMIPPMGPSWWTLPCDEFTRLQYHSFITDPDLNLDPDYTCDGYTPSVPDQWTCPDAYNNVLVPPQLSDWGDGIAILVGDGEEFSKPMGNLANPSVDKEYWVQIVFKAVDGTYGTYPELPELDITAPGSIYEHKGAVAAATGRTARIA